jgi:uncharacterized membrane protein YdfJ with MMPL/SSD domain
VTLARARAVVLVWIAGLLASGVIISAVPGNIANGGLSVPNSDTAKAEALIGRYIPSLAGTPIVAVATSSRPGARSNVEQQQQADIEATIQPLARVQDVATVLHVAWSSYENNRDRPETLGIYLICVYLPYPSAERRIPAIEGALARSARHYVSFALLGEAAASFRYSTVLRRDLDRAAFIALPAMLCVLVVAFLSVIAAFLPVALAAVTLVYALAIIHMISLVFGLSVFVIDIASGIALGLSIDYSLIIVTRFREERATAHTVSEAVARALHTAGRAVVLSGLTIAVMLPALMVVDMGLFTSIALGGIIASLTALAVATTLLPATLLLLGDRIDRLSIKRAVSASRRATFWRYLARTVTTHPRTAALTSLAALVALALPALSLHLDYNPAALLSSPSVSGEEEHLVTALGAGATGPVEIITREPELVLPVLRHDPNERVILGDVEGVAHWSALFALLNTSPGSTASHQTVTRLRSEFADHHIAALVAGATAFEMDLASRVRSRLPLVIALVTVIALIALLLGLRSIVIPLKAMVCSALSVTATLGLLRLCFPSSGGSSGIACFVPIVAFALVLGLSVDYEVFLLSRIRELAASGYATAPAVSLGLARTARPITLAGLAVTTVFAAFILSSLKEVQELGVAVTIGVVLDVTLVRWILSPACVVLAGRWNWWLPNSLIRHRARSGESLAQDLPSLPPCDESLPQ